MSIFEKLLSIEKDINILEEFGDYKSAKVLHDKFIRIAKVASLPSQINSGPVDPVATVEQNEVFDRYKDIIDDKNKYNRIKNNVMDEIPLSNQMTEIQKQKLVDYAKEKIEEYDKENANAAKPAQQPAQQAAQTLSPTSGPRVIDLTKASPQTPFGFKPGESMEIRRDFPNGEYVIETTNPDYTTNKTYYYANNNIRAVQKNIPPEFQRVKYMTSPGNWTTTTIPAQMDPKMVYRPYFDRARIIQQEEQFEPGFSGLQTYPGNPENTPVPTSSATSVSPTSAGPAGEIKYPRSYLVKPNETKPTVTDSSGNSITSSFGDKVTSSSRIKKKFIRLAQENNNSQNLNQTGQVTQQPTSSNQQVNQQLQQQVDANKQNPQQAPKYSPEIEDLITKYSNTNAPSSFASLLNYVGVKLNIGLPQVVDILASKNVAIAGKSLSTHKNKEILKQKLSSIQPSRSMNNNQLGQVVMYAMTDHNMPDGTPIKLSKYERLGLFRSTPEQEAVYLAQKIRHIQSGDAVPKSALLPRV